MKNARPLALSFAAALALSAFSAPVSARDAGKGEVRKEKKVQTERERIDALAQEALDRVLASDPQAKKLFGEADGWAGFNNLKVAVGITGGGGNGVAVNKKTGERTYMKMGTGGVNVGLGAQKYQLVFLFQTAEALANFITQGWQADASAAAAAGKNGANAEATFRDGVAVFQMTDKGLMLSADLTGTKYWKNDKLSP